MPAVSKDTVEFSAKVPREQYDAFKENFGQYGAVQWFINESLAEFNRKIAEQPSLKEQVNAAIESMLRANRNGDSHE